MPTTVPEKHQDYLLKEILELISALSDRMAFHAADRSPFWVDEHERSKNRAALYWMKTSLEDLEATALGISMSGRP